MVQSRPQDTRLFKLGVLATLILTFIAVATSKIWELRIAAERVGVLHTIGSLRSAIGLKLSEQIIQNGVVSLEALHHSNPMQLWDPPPINYLGAFSTQSAPQDQRIWYFNTDENALIYQIRFIDHFNNSNHQYPNQARYQLQLSYQDSNNNLKYDSLLDTITGLSLQPMGNYIWSIEEKQ